jgi:ABC-type dipeptide/oligopeptide/nickel transport system permease component
MGRYLTRRLLQTLLVLVGVTFLSYFTLYFSGDPTYLYVSENATAEEIENTRRTLGFDRPIVEQYINYIARVLRGDFGTSLANRQAVLPLVLERLPATLELALFAMLISTMLAIPIGIIAAVNRGTPIDGMTMLLAMLGQSMPSFWLGIMLILFVGLQLRLLPISGQIPILQPLLAGAFDLNTLPDAIRHLIMPGFTVGAFSLARNARLVRSSMLETLPLEYVNTARAKGLRTRAVVMRHAFRNALIPIVTILGLEFGFLLSGVVITETIFSWPGIGRLVFNAINQKDIPMVQAAVIFFSFLFVLLNLIVDMLYAWLDPRVRLN